MVFRVEDLWFIRVWGLGFRVKGLGCCDQGFWFRIQRVGFGFRVQCSGTSFWNLEFGV